MNFKTNIEELDTREIVNSEYINWDFFKNSTIMITGATGLIGEQIVKSIILANEEKNTNIKILALVRNKKKALEKFSKNKNLKFIIQDISKHVKYNGNVDFIIHTANSTSSRDFVEKPVETIDSIMTGTTNILEFGKSKNIKGMVYLSSMEVFGKTDFEKVEPLKEEDYGYIDILNTRSSYPEGKKLAETLCHSYCKEYNVPVKIARLVQTIGAGVNYNDNRVFAQFARNICEKKNIVLKTTGDSARSYCYVTDTITALFTLLEKGNNGETYNVANESTNCSIKELAYMLTDKYQDSKVEFQLDDTLYPPATKLFVNATKLKELNWRAKVDLEEMFSRLVQNFSDIVIKNKIKKLTFLQKLFSVRNEYTSKIIKIFGLDIRFNMEILIKKFYKLPVEKNKIVFSNFNGNGYGCNPKYITKEILKRGLNYDLVWLVNKNVNTNDMPKEIRIVDFKSSKANKELITAKIWIDNYRKISHLKKGIKKRENQKYIQTWHGSLGIKKLDADVKMFNNSFNKSWLYLAKNDSQIMDYLITNSSFEENVLKNALWFNNETKQFGHPRNDIFFYNETELNKIKQKVFKSLNIKENNKIFLYVPSFRDDYRLNCYMLNLENIQNTLKKKFGNDWTILIRVHPKISKYSKKLFNYNDTIIDASKYSDIQELLASADIAMTDYSSCIFDFMLSRKPAFIFATDIEEYNTDRGFYYPLESTPFPIATNNDELIKNIENFDNDKYQTKVEEFLKEKGCMEDGHASERVVNLIEEIINKD